MASDTKNVNPGGYRDLPVNHVSTKENGSISKLINPLEASCALEFDAGRFTLSFSSTTYLNFRPDCLKVKHNNFIIFNANFRRDNGNKVYNNEAFNVAILFEKAAIDFSDPTNPITVNFKFVSSSLFLLQDTKYEAEYTFNMAPVAFNNQSVSPPLSNIETSFKPPSLDLQGPTTFRQVWNQSSDVQLPVRYDVISPGSGSDAQLPIRSDNMSSDDQPSKTNLRPINFNRYRFLPVNEVKVMAKENGKKLKVPQNVLVVSCKFEYLEEKFFLRFTSSQFRFNPTTLDVSFRKQSIFHRKFVTGTFYEGEESLVVEISFKKTNIDFFGFNKDRVFKIEFSFASNTGVKFDAIYSIALPNVKTSELHFKPPLMGMPDALTREMCSADFKMKAHNSPEAIKRVIQLEEFKVMELSDRYKVYGYVEMLRVFMNIENSFELDLLNKCYIPPARIARESAINFKVSTPRQIPSAASSAYLTPIQYMNTGLDEKQLRKVQISGSIIGYHAKYFVIEVKRGANMKFDSKELYNVVLRPNFYSNAMAERGLKNIQRAGYENFFLDFCESSLPTRSSFEFQQFDKIEWLNINIADNAAQSQAIKHILNRTAFPSPYIVFGPPGTGKTSTLVEAVAQIVKLQPKSKVLVTVNSNSACDEIGERLMKFVGWNKMYRFYSPSFAKKMERVNQQLKKCSNLRYGYHIQPSVQELISYNVIISTLVNSGRMKSLGADIFDYIFIDECASSAEPFVSIPMNNAIAKSTPLKASFVLLGDPKQLGQVMRTHHSERYGFGVSMMERVMEMNRYQFSYNGYDPRFIVQLTDNFRSHSSILQYSNKQFYNSILKAKQKENVANFALGWELLPNKDFPLIFHTSWAASMLDDTSCYNDGDIRIVKKYVSSLLKDGINGNRVSAKDIGIICPYAAQRERLKLTFTNGVEIGTVEYFQGREKLIIILSTVRSKTPTVGFLKNEKRLNVALTRAKALLIVIGNPETLSKSKFWRKFIKLCCKNQATVGHIPAFMWGKRSKKQAESEDDADEIMRREEMMNEMGLED